MTIPQRILLHVVLGAGLVNRDERHPGNFAVLHAILGQAATQRGFIGMRVMFHNNPFSYSCSYSYSGRFLSPRIHRRAVVERARAGGHNAFTGL